jgi:hypothetical protein
MRSNIALISVTVMAARNHHHGFRSAQSEKTQHGDNNDDETDDIDDVVHGKPPCDGVMPVRQKENPTTWPAVASTTGVIAPGIGIRDAHHGSGPEP